MPLAKKKESVWTSPKGRARVPTQAQLAVFFQNLTEYAHVTDACRAAGISRVDMYRRKKEDKAFSDAWDEAISLGIDALEQECVRRAQHGVKKPVYFKGRVVGYERHYSDVLAMFLMKGARPEKYRERHELSGKGGGPVTFNLLNSKEED